jgi:site-specific recombinase XerD
MDVRNSWIRHLQAENKSPRTIQTYLSALDHLEASTEPLGATRNDLEAFLTHRLGLVKASSVCVDFRSLQQLYKWLSDEGEIETNPMARMRKPHVSEEPIAIYSDADIAKLLLVSQGKDFSSRRDLAIIRLLIDTGMRRSELAGINLSDLDLKAQTVNVLGKGRRIRQVPFGTKTAVALDRYLRLRNSHKDSALPNLWLGKHGAVSSNGIYEIVQSRGKQAGLTGRVFIHKFRHLFAHSWQMAGGNEMDLMRICGWSSNAMLGRYGKSAADVRAKESHRRLAIGDRY